MFDWLRKIRSKAPEERALEPVSLSENPMMKEGKLAGLIAIPLLAFLVLVIYVAKTFYITQEEFMMLMGSGFGMWICLLAVIYSVSISHANQHNLHDRGLGFLKGCIQCFKFIASPKT